MHDDNQIKLKSQRRGFQRSVLTGVSGGWRRATAVRLSSLHRSITSPSPASTLRTSLLLPSWWCELRSPTTTVRKSRHATAFRTHGWSTTDTRSGLFLFLRVKNSALTAPAPCPRWPSSSSLLLSSHGVQYPATSRSTSARRRRCALDRTGLVEDDEDGEDEDATMSGAHVRPAPPPFGHPTFLALPKARRVLSLDREERGGRNRGEGEPSTSAALIGNRAGGRRTSVPCRAGPGRHVT
jgi:hypothetical protein